MRQRWLAVMAGVLLAAVAALAARPVNWIDVMSLKGVSSAVISPDGHWVLFQVTAWSPDPAAQKKPVKETRISHIWMVSATDPSGAGAARQITFGLHGEHAPAWSPDGRNISFIADRPNPDAAAGAPAAGQLYIMRADGGEARAVTSGEGGVSGYAWAPDGGSIAFLRQRPPSIAEQDARKLGVDQEMFEGDFPPTQLWLVNVASGTQTNLTAAFAMTAKGTPVWAPNGGEIVFTAAPTPMLRDSRSNLYLLTLAGDHMRQLTHGASAVSAPAWSPDGRTLAYVFSPDSRKALADGIPLSDTHRDHLILMDTATWTAHDTATPAFDLAAGAPIWTADSQHIIFVTGQQVYRTVFGFYVPSGLFRPLSPEGLFALDPHGTFSRDGRHLAFIQESATSPGDVYAADDSFAAPRRLTHINPQTTDFSLGETSVIQWKNPQDGWPVQGILVKPVGYQPGHRYPMLLEVHGGPTGAFSDGYNLAAQVWAGKGWAVLFTNPRGSTGYGEKFLRGNLEDWGGGDYRDIMSGVDYVVGQGIADPDKLAEWGWSYGGYMTCWIVSQSQRFKAAMMGAGLSDLVSMYGATDIPDYLGGFFNGYPDPATAKLYRERSGITYVDQVSTPLLILQGANDHRVPTSQSLEFFRALNDRGKTVQLVFYPRERHGFVEYYHILDRHRRIFDWISHYTLGAEPAAPPVGH